MKYRIFFAVVSLACAITVQGSQADPLAPPGIDDSEWRFSITPYAHIPVKVYGVSTVAGQTMALDWDTSGALDLLEFAFAARIEAWKDNFGIILDGNYVDLGADGTVTGPGPLNLSAAVNVDIRQYYQDVQASYRIINQPYNADGDLWTLEVMGGPRFNYLKQKVDLKVGGGSTALGGSDTWVDPMIGARVSTMLNERWTLGLRGDAGGFGVSDTDLTWSVTGGFDYRPWEKTSLKFGYRYYSIDYASSLSDGAFELDNYTHGPYFGVTFNFQ